jgi:hypothetical protein
MAKTAYSFQGAVVIREIRDQGIGNRDRDRDRD